MLARRKFHAHTLSSLSSTTTQRQKRLPSSPLRSVALSGRVPLCVAHNQSEPASKTRPLSAGQLGHMCVHRCGNAAAKNANSRHPPAHHKRKQERDGSAKRRPSQGARLRGMGRFTQPSGCAKFRREIWIRVSGGCAQSAHSSEPPLLS